MRCLTLLPFLTLSISLIACTPDPESATETGTGSASSTSSSTTGTSDTTTDTTGDPPATTTDTTGDPPATTTDTADTTTADPTTEATTTEATTEATTGDPLDDCAFLVDQTFKSDEELECGLGPNGVELCNWTISFTADTYVHQYSDVGDGGTYTCDAGVITATSDGQQPHVGTIDAATGELVWDDVVYHPAP